MFVTITFRSFTPTPGGLEFQPGKDYYFISTSTPDDLHNRFGGRCTTHSMKVIFKVVDNSISQESEVHNTRKKNKNRSNRKRVRNHKRKKLKLRQHIYQTVNYTSIPLNDVKHFKSNYVHGGTYRHIPYINNKYSHLRENEVLKHDSIAVKASRMQHSGSSPLKGRSISKFLSFYNICFWTILVIIR